MKTRRKSPVNLTITEQQHCSIDLRLKILSRLPFFADLSRNILETINKHFIEIAFQAGDVVYMAGDVADRLYVVAEGKIKLLQHSISGHDVLLNILTTGEFFGNLAMLGIATHPDTALAQAPCCILSISSDSFRQILDEHPELALKTIHVLSDRLTSANQRVLQISSMPVEKRIASTLLELGRKLGRTNENILLIDVPLSREDLAGMTGTTPETVSRVMSQLQTSGIIESGRQWVGIRDMTRLETITNSA